MPVKSQSGRIKTIMQKYARKAQTNFKDASTKLTCTYKISVLYKIFARIPATLNAFAGCVGIFHYFFNGIKTQRGGGNCDTTHTYFAVARTHKAERNESVCWYWHAFLPGCVWDWSHPTLWLLLREILRADWCLVARRLGHLGRGRHCWGRILIWVTGMARKVQGNIRSDKNDLTMSQRQKRIIAKCV